MRISKVLLTVAITALTANAFAASPVKCSHQPNKVSLGQSTNPVTTEAVKSAKTVRTHK